tara:strand:- start:983 stop:2386 length:1404 start_codon:yes stop_codon:yes gene_type:complete
MKNSIIIFTNNLRFEDNKLLSLLQNDKSILPIYVHDELFFSKPLGSASKVWLHHSLLDLKNRCPELSFYKGNFVDTVVSLAKKFDISKVVVSEHYFPKEIQALKQLSHELNAISCELKCVNTSLLWHPNDVLKDDGTPYKVFTPFYRKGCLGADLPDNPQSIFLSSFCSDPNSLSLEFLDLLPDHQWAQDMIQDWDISESGAKKTLDNFLNNGIQRYKEGRDFPALQSVSRLSAYIRFGNISINTIWHSAAKLPQSKHVDHFLSELGWREFSYSLLYHFPTMITNNLQKKFDKFPWKDNASLLRAWQKGLTGYPIVDAGMRELWQTGYMHNRVRMIVGSFLVKNLLIHWHHGEAWFWDCLVDADPASNVASWQWVAGCGADAAPYFRIFNPITQGKKFDPNGDYILRYLPELENLPKKYLFSPWEAPSEILKAANIELGKSYPLPIVDLRESRELALAAFQSLKETS